jgi:hypothetical protein
MNIRLYGLFEKHGERWKRVHGTAAYPLNRARHIYQSALLAGAFGYRPLCSLRPVRVRTMAQVISQATGVQHGIA